MFLVEMKASSNKVKGIQNKLEPTQGILVPSNGRSGGFATLWREGTNIRFKSCSNSHINVVLFGEQSMPPWRATGFYKHPDASKRHTLWKLLETLKEQCIML